MPMRADPPLNSTKAMPGRIPAWLISMGAVLPVCLIWQALPWFAQPQGLLSHRYVFMLLLGLSAGISAGMTLAPMIHCRLWTRIGALIVFAAVSVLALLMIYAARYPPSYLVTKASAERAQLLLKVAQGLGGVWMLGAAWLAQVPFGRLLARCSDRAVWAWGAALILGILLADHIAPWGRILYAGPAEAVSAEQLRFRLLGLQVGEWTAVGLALAAASRLDAAAGRLRIARIFAPACILAAAILCCATPLPGSNWAAALPISLVPRDFTLWLSAALLGQGLIAPLTSRTLPIAPDGKS